MTTNKFNSYFIWILTALFFAFQFSLRNSHALYVDELIYKFNINATAFSLFSSMFYVTYSTMQIPAGMLLDSKQPKYVIPFFITLYSLSALLFANAENFYIALLARLLMGIGATFGFLGCAKIISMYFGKKQYSFMISLTFTAGFLGAMYGGKPVAALISSLGWHSMFDILVPCGLIIAVINFFFIKKLNKSSLGDSENIGVFKQVKAVINNKNVVFVAICGGLMMGPTEGFADGWGVKYLMQAYDIPKEEASFITSMIYFGLCFGGPILIRIAEKFDNYYLITAISGLLMTILFMVLLFIDSIPVSLLYVICFAIGSFCGSQVLIFGINDTYVSNNQVAITAAVTNCIVMSSGVFMHTIIGLSIDYLWPGTINVLGQKLFGAEEIRVALLIIPITMAIGSGLIYSRYKSNSSRAIKS